MPRLRRVDCSTSGITRRLRADDGAGGRPLPRQHARGPTTCAVCADGLHAPGLLARSSCIDLRVFDCFQSGWTISGMLESLGADTAVGESSTQGLVEEAVIDLLEDNRASPAVERVTALA